MHARTASRVPGLLKPPPVAVLWRLHFSMHAGSFWALAGVMAVSDESIPAARARETAWTYSPWSRLSSVALWPLVVNSYRHRASLLPAFLLLWWLE
jgi:hypothetical protein